MYGVVTKKYYKFTLPKSNKALKKIPSQKETSLPTIHFQALC